MDRNMKAIAGLLVAAGLAGCKTDPTAVLEGTGPQSVVSTFSFVSFNVGDSLLVKVTARDGGNNPLEDTATVASADATIASVKDYSVAPLLAKGFYVKGVKKGTTTVTATAGTASAAIKVVVN